MLSKQIAECLGGSLELLAQGELVGSTFVTEICLRPLISLKAQVQEFPKSNELQESKEQKVLAGLKVLLVEDSKDNQLLISKFLQKAGADVAFASDGAQGVESALAGEFDVLLMDIQMPIMDGHESARKLRAANYEKPIIALTAHAMKEERAKCIESGFTEFLTKPIQRVLLIEMLSNFMHTTPDLALYSAASGGQIETVPSLSLAKPKLTLIPR